MVSIEGHYSDLLAGKTDTMPRGTWNCIEPYCRILRHIAYEVEKLPPSLIPSFFEKFDKKAYKLDTMGIATTEVRFRELVCAAFPECKISSSWIYRKAAPMQ